MSQTVSSSVMSPAAALTCDVVVVGGGLVGGTLACGLAQHGVSTICIDKDDAGVLLDTGYDGRSSAIALACQRVLEGTGVWAHMVSDVQPILDIRVTDSNSPLHLHYDHREVGAPMGYMAENRTIRRGILARFAELEKATLLAPAAVATVDRRVDGATVTLTDGRVIHARLVVAADGRRSQIRDMAGIRLQHGLPYNQVGIVMTVWHEKDHRGIAHERFLPSGPFAILPLPGGHHSSLVWTEKDPLAWTILKLPDAEFQAELMSRFGDFLGEVKVVSKRFGYPLTLQHASRYIDLRLALVGDAAHGMHPVAGQGMNFGLRDVAALIEKVVEARRLGVDVGAATVLEGYQKWRRFDNVLMLGMTDGLVRLFSNDIAPLRLARTAGMAVVNRLPGLKRFFMRHAMGDVGALPKLMQGEPL